MNKILALIDLFRKGEAVANKAAWKRGQITVTALGGVMLAGTQVASAFGYDLPTGVTEETVNYLAAGIIGVTNIVLTYITSDKVGILPEKK